LEKPGPEAEVAYHAKDGECISSLRPQPEWFHSPTHDPQSSIISLCARWPGVSCRRHGGGSRGSYSIKAATLGGIVGVPRDRANRAELEHLPPIVALLTRRQYWDNARLFALPGRPAKHGFSPTVSLKATESPVEPTVEEA